MRLQLSISSAQASSLADGGSASFHLRGGTIGRGRDNDWILPDAERVISTHHAVIHYESGQYFFEDSSSNGSFLNDPGTLMPRGQLVPLHHGDLLYIGDYEIQVELAEDTYGAQVASEQAASPLPSEFIPRPYVPNSSIPAQSGNDWDYLNQSPDPGRSAAPPSQPLGDWGHSATPSLPPLASGPSFPATRSDHGPADQQPFRPPMPSAEIIGEDASAPVGEILPDNWWNEDEETHPALDNPALDNHPPTPLPATDFSAPPDFTPVPEPISAAPVSSEPLPPTAPPASTGPSATPVSNAFTSKPTPGEPAKPSPMDPFAETAELASAPIAAPTRAPDPPVIAQPGPDIRLPPAMEAEQQPLPTTPSAQRAPDPSPANHPADPSPLVSAFLNGLAVEPTNALTEAQALELMRLAGHLLRLVTQSTAEVLQARSALKSEFRLNQTILRPAENNPLKFSLNLDQTLRDLLLDHRPGYLEPETAFKEAMTDIKHHEIAVMAGMRAAFECLIEKFSPETVENSLRARGKGGKRLPLTDRTWHYYLDYFREFKANAGDEFDGIFGQDFVRAYEEQIEQLMGRK